MIKSKVHTGENVSFLTRKVAAANQNVAGSYDRVAPQWYDVKFLIERMFDLRGMVRDAIARRKEAELTRQRVANSPTSRQIVTAEIHGHNMDIALAWHDYRVATATYHSMWNVYRRNLKKF